MTHSVIQSNAPETNPEKGQNADSSIDPTIQPTWYEEFRLTIIAGLTASIEILQQTALKYVEAIDRDSAFREYLADETPEVSGTVWRTLEKVGRGVLDPRIAAGGVPYSNKLRRLPIHEQRQALDNTMSLLTQSGDTLQVRLDAIMPRQADQIFAPNHIRGLSEQRAWIEALRVSAVAKAKPASPIEVDKKHKRIIVNGIALSVSDLADFLKQLS